MKLLEHLNNAAVAALQLFDGQSATVRFTMYISPESEKHLNRIAQIIALQLGMDPRGVTLEKEACVNCAEDAHYVWVLAVHRLCMAHALVTGLYAEAVARRERFVRECSAAIAEELYRVYCAEKDKFSGYIEVPLSVEQNAFLTENGSGHTALLLAQQIGFYTTDYEKYFSYNAGDSTFLIQQLEEISKTVRGIEFELKTLPLAPINGTEPDIVFDPGQRMGHLSKFRRDQGAKCSGICQRFSRHRSHHY